MKLCNIILQCLLNHVHIQPNLDPNIDVSVTGTVTGSLQSFLSCPEGSAAIRGS